MIRIDNHSDIFPCPICERNPAHICDCKPDTPSPQIPSNCWSKFSFDNIQGSSTSTVNLQTGTDELDDDLRLFKELIETADKGKNGNTDTSGNLSQGVNAEIPSEQDLEPTNNERNIVDDAINNPGKSDKIENDNLVKIIESLPISFSDNVELGTNKINILSIETPTAPLLIEVLGVQNTNENGCSTRIIKKKGKENVIPIDTENDINRRIEKRVMMQKEKLESIDIITKEFFEQDKILIDQQIKSMSHSKRLWLCMKFHDDPPKNVSFNKLCKLFGIPRSNMNKQIHKNKLSYSDFAQYGGLSPVEIDKNRTRFLAMFEKYASNFDELVSEGYLKLKK